MGWTQLHIHCRQPRGSVHGASCSLHPKPPLLDHQGLAYTTCKQDAAGWYWSSPPTSSEMLIQPMEPNEFDTPALDCTQALAPLKRRGTLPEFWLSKDTTRELGNCPCHRCNINTSGFRNISFSNTAHNRLCYNNSKSASEGHQVSHFPSLSAKVLVPCKSQVLGSV